MDDALNASARQAGAAAAEFGKTAVTAGRKNIVYLVVGAVLGALLLGLVSCVANAAEPPRLRLATGGDGGNYFYAGNLVAQQAKGVIAVEVQTSQGSMQNLDRLLNGEADAAFVQNDAMIVYANKNPRSLANLERAGVLYREYVHLVCNKARSLGKITGLTKNDVVAIGPLGSGSAVTWDGFVLADKGRYGPVGTDPRASLRALNAVADGSQVSCMIFTAALNSSFVVDDVQKLADRVVLVNAADSDFDDKKDARGKPIYSKTDIPGGTYKQLQPGVFSSAVGTVAVEALVVVRTDWIDANERAYDQLSRALQRAMPEIKKKVGQ